MNNPYRTNAKITHSSWRLALYSFWHSLILLVYAITQHVGVRVSLSARPQEHLDEAPSRDGFDAYIFLVLCVWLTYLFFH